MPTRTKRSTRSTSRGRSAAAQRDSGNFTNVLDTAREHPFTAAAAAGAVGALAAGVFLWSRREQIGDQFNHLMESVRGEDQPELELAGAQSTATDSTTRTTARGKGMSETGGGNASLGRRTGGGGVRGTASGRGRVRAVRTSAMS